MDPSYEAQHDELNAAHEEYVGLIRRGNRAAEAGTVAMAIFAVVVIGLLLRRQERVRRAEEALRYSEERFRSLVQDGADLILILDAKGDVRYASSSVGTVLGHEPGDATGRSFLQLLDPGESPKLQGLLDGLREKPGAKVTTELRARHADGHGLLLLEATCSNMTENQSIGGIVVNARDVTERKRAVESLRRSQTRLSEAQRMARLGNWEWNVVTGEAWWSEEVFRIYGYDPDAFVPTFERFMDVVVHPDDRERLGRAISGALRHRREYALDHRVVLPDGTTRFVRRQARVDHGEGGEPLRMVGTVQDITERKRLEERLEH